MRTKSAHGEHCDRSLSHADLVIHVRAKRAVVSMQKCKISEDLCVVWTGRCRAVRHHLSLTQSLNPSCHCPYPSVINHSQHATDAITPARSGTSDWFFVAGFFVSAKTTGYRWLRSFADVFLYFVEAVVKPGCQFGGYKNQICPNCLWRKSSFTH